MSKPTTPEQTIVEAITKAKGLPPRQAVHYLAGTLREQLVPKDGSRVLTASNDYVTTGALNNFLDDYEVGIQVPLNRLHDLGLGRFVVGGLQEQLHRLVQWQDSHFTKPPRRQAPRKHYF
jgi:hypothetical protein